MENVWKICGFPNLEGTENIQYMENVWKMYGKYVVFLIRKVWKMEDDGYK